MVAPVVATVGAIVARFITKFGAEAAKKKFKSKDNHFVDPMFDDIGY